MESTTNNNYNVAASALALLKDGIANNNKAKILEAYAQVEHESFDWDGLEILFDEWDGLLGESNDILYEN